LFSHGFIIQVSLQLASHHTPHSLQAIRVRFEHDPSLSKGEPPEAYKIGGFHPTYIGDVLDSGNYRIARKLGYGSMSTVWLAQDTRSNRYVVIKIHTAEYTVDDAATLISYHDTIAASGHPGRHYVQKLLGMFVHKDPNGDHVCLLYEPLGRNMETFKDDEERSPMTTPFTREICRQLVLALDCLHSSGIFQRDIQPGNMILSLAYDINAKSEEEINTGLTAPRDEDDGEPDAKFMEEHPDRFLVMSEANPEYAGLIGCDVRRLDGQPLTQHEQKFIFAVCPLYDGIKTSDVPPTFTIQLSDLGDAVTHALSTPTDIMVTPLGVRSPQAILKTHPFSYHAADVWALGMILWELVTRERLVAEPWADIDGSMEECNDEHLQEIVRVLGAMPATVRKHWPRADACLDENGQLLPQPDKMALVVDGDVDALSDQDDTGDHVAEVGLDVDTGGDADKIDDDLDTDDDMDIFSGIHVPGDMANDFTFGRPADMTDDEAAAFLDLLKRMMAWEEKDRASTKELLEHPWIKGAGSGVSGTEESE
jgi:serine/threonine protein kinase